MVPVRQLARPFVEGFAFATLGALALLLTMPSGWSEWGALEDGPAFARKWGAGCQGWNTHVAARYLIGNLEHWYAYVTIAFVLRRLHPIVSYTWASWWAIHSAFVFFIGCGLMHLLEAYAVFNPVYDLVAYALLANGKLSLAGSFFISIALTMAFAEVQRRRADLEDELERLRSEGGG